jgi:hypothetical protein
MSRSNPTRYDARTGAPGPRTDPDLLAPDERAALTRALRRTSAAARAPSLSQTVEWARSVRLHALILESVLTGKVDILLSDDGSQMIFREHAAQGVVPIAGYQRRPAS